MKWIVTASLIWMLVTVVALLLSLYLYTKNISEPWGKAIERRDWAACEKYLAASDKALHAMDFPKWQPWKWISTRGPVDVR